MQGKEKTKHGIEEWDLSFLECALGTVAMTDKEAGPKWKEWWKCNIISKTELFSPIIRAAIY